MNRAQLLDEVSARIRGRRLVWAGLRADDVKGLEDLPDGISSFSLIGPTEPEQDPRSLALDEMSGRRVDPEIWDVDAYPNDPVVRRFRTGLLAALASPSVLMPYRSTEFLSSIQLARCNTSQILGLFGGQQSLFEYKPWVELAVASAGIHSIPWRYVAAEDRGLLRGLPEGDYLARRSRTSGGEGITRITSMTDLIEDWPDSPDHLVSIAPFIESVPINVGATAWRDGVTVHNPSVQLIGIPSCVSREFGHCGNDFGAMRRFSRATVEAIEQSTIAVGDWLRSQGYLGSFGVDFLVTEDHVLFAEVNPRFQGSTRASCRIDAGMGLPCLLLEHLAAWLGVARIDGPNLCDRVASAEAITSVVVHWTGAEPRRLNAADLVRRVEIDRLSVQADVVTSPHVINDPGSTVVRLTVPGSLTQSGFDLDARLVAAIDDWHATQAKESDLRMAPGAIPTQT